MTTEDRILEELKAIKEELQNLRYLTHTVAIVVKSIPENGEPNEQQAIAMFNKLKELYKDY